MSSPGSLAPDISLSLFLTPLSGQYLGAGDAPSNDSPVRTFFPTPLFLHGIDGTCETSYRCNHYNVCTFTITLSLGLADTTRPPTTWIIDSTFRQGLPYPKHPCAMLRSAEFNNVDRILLHSFRRCRISLNHCTHDHHIDNDSFLTTTKICADWTKSALTGRCYGQ